MQEMFIAGEWEGIPCSRLPHVHRLGKALYTKLPHHTNGVKALLKFIFDPRIQLEDRLRAGGTTKEWQRTMEE